MIGKPANETAYKKQRYLAVKFKKYLLRNQVTDNIKNIIQTCFQEKSIHYQQKFTFKYDVKKNYCNYCNYFQ